MLSKLLKYEIRDTARVIPLLYLITVLFAVMVFTGKQLQLGWLIGISSGILILVGIAVVIITFVIIVMRFNRNLYSNEGYLMFTLPVKPQLLLVSKTIVALFWLFISFIVFIVALYVGMNGLGINELVFSEMMEEFKQYGLDKFVYLLIPMCILATLYLVAQIFFAITVANRPAFDGIGAAAGFLVFLAINVVLKIFESIASIFVPFSIEFNVFGNSKAAFTTQNMFAYLLDSIKGINPTTVVIGLGGYIFAIIMIFVLFYLTGRMMNKKVSLR